MTRRGYTHKPCHGCGTVDLHPTDGVCFTCSRALRTYQRIMEEAKDIPEVTHGIPQAAHFLPYLRAEKDNSLRTEFHKLSQLVSKPAGVGSRTFLWSNEYVDWAEYRVFPSDVAQSLSDLFKEVKVALERAYAQGQEHGRNLLMQLASGGITNDAFNDSAARLDKKL